MTTEHACNQAYNDGVKAFMEQALGQQECPYNGGSLRHPIPGVDVTAETLAEFWYDGWNDAEGDEDEEEGQ